MSTGAPAEIVVERRLEWVDTDASTRYHSSAVIRLFEVAETLLLDRLGLLRPWYGRFPRVHLEMDMRRSLYFFDPVEVWVQVAEVGRSSVTYAFRLARDGEACAEGRVTAVRVNDEGKPTAVTDEERRLLLTAGPQPPERLTAG